VIPPGASAQRTILYLHGGGYAVGAPRGYREMMSRIARAAQAQALTIDYRLAPENPHPAAVEDAVAAYRYWRVASSRAAPCWPVIRQEAG
jgi:epsilon-lactone hydrolase